ncbi:MAG TPA: mevalonate kinase [Stenomitos sp.]
MTATRAQSVVERAPAKIILIGEHAVVYGHPAIALPFPPLSARGTAVPAEEGTAIRSDRYSGMVARLQDGYDIPAPLRPAAEAVRASLEAIERAGGPVLPFDLFLESDIPPGSGLGSSAAIAVAAVRATFAFHGRKAPPAVLRLLATRAEAIAHGTSSGLDPTTVAADGPIRFVRDRAPIDLNVVRPFGLVVADSGETAATGEMVMRVKTRLEESPEAQTQLARLGELAEQAVWHLEHGEYAELGAGMDEAHLLLGALGVSTDRLDAIVTAARNAGAYGAKLSGAGGGGCAVALVPIERLMPVAEAMRAAGATQAWPTQYLIESDTHESH